MALVIRILMVIFGYVLACVAAAVILVVGTLTLQGTDLSALDTPTWALSVLIIIAAAMIGAVALMPSFLMIALAEGFVWRSVLLYGVLGGVLGLALGYGDTGFLASPNSSLARESEILAASGIAGGLVYWLFAGRNAGAWKISTNRDEPASPK